MRLLIAREDDGNLDAAARRLHLSPDELRHLEDIIAGDSSSRRAVLLASVVRSYHTDACWLLTGQESASLADLPPQTRLEVARLLSEIGNNILSQYRDRRTPPRPHS